MATEQEFFDALQAEEERMAFVLGRDGEEGKLDFAARILKVYCEAMNSNKVTVANLRDYHYLFFASCLIFEDVLGISKLIRTDKREDYENDNDTSH